MLSRFSLWLCVFRGRIGSASGRQRRCASAASRPGRARAARLPTSRSREPRPLRSCEMIVTAFRSESKPTPSRETSLTTIASSDFDASFLRAFSSTFSVSAANPTTICEVFRRATSARISAVGSSSSVISPLRLIFCSAAAFGRKSATAAVLITTVALG